MKSYSQKELCLEFTRDELSLIQILLHDKDYVYDKNDTELQQEVDKFRAELLREIHWLKVEW